MTAARGRVRLWQPSGVIKMSFMIWLRRIFQFNEKYEKIVRRKSGKTMDSAGWASKRETTKDELSSDVRWNVLRSLSIFQQVLRKALPYESRPTANEKTSCTRPLTISPFSSLTCPKIFVFDQEPWRRLERKWNNAVLEIQWKIDANYNRKESKGFEMLNVSLWESW